MAGRPTKYNQERVDKITDALREGKTRKAACALAGIGETTLERWIEKYGDFGETLARAEGEAEASYTDYLKLAAEGGAVTSETVTEKFDKDGNCIGRTTSKSFAPPNVQATTFYLERRRSGDWRKPSEDLNVNHHGAVKVYLDPVMGEV